MHWGRSCPRDTQPAAACHPAIADGARAGQDAPTENGREQPMGIVEILGVAGSLSLLAGWRLYLTILATGVARSEEHTSELQSLMRISYAVFCLKKKKNTKKHTRQPQIQQ